MIEIQHDVHEHSGECHLVCGECADISGVIVLLCAINSARSFMFVDGLCHHYHVLCIYLGCFGCVGAVDRMHTPFLDLCQRFDESLSNASLKRGLCWVVIQTSDLG